MNKSKDQGCWGGEGGGGGGMSWRQWKCANLHDGFAGIHWHEDDPEERSCRGSRQSLDTHIEVGSRFIAVQQSQCPRICSSVTKSGERPLEESWCQSSVEPGDPTIPVRKE